MDCVWWSVMHPKRVRISLCFTDVWATTRGGCVSRLDWSHGDWWRETLISFGAHCLNCPSVIHARLVLFFDPSKRATTYSSFFLRTCMLVCSTSFSYFLVPFFFSRNAMSDRLYEPMIRLSSSSLSQFFPNRLSYYPFLSVLKALSSQHCTRWLVLHPLHCLIKL